MDTPGNPVTDKPRRFKWLRIAVSAVFVILALALSMLWVRSYFSFDYVRHFNGNVQQLLRTRDGKILFKWQVDADSPQATVGWQYEIDGTDTYGTFMPTFYVPPFDRLFGFSKIEVPTGRAFLWWAPLWFVSLVFGIIAFALWLPWSRFRFSLKTMMIAVTVIAVLLGLVTWAVRG